MRRSMLKLLETLKDSAESTFDSAASRVENVHRLIGGYVGGHARRLRGNGATRQSSGKPSQEYAKPADVEVSRGDTNIYDVIRGVNREVGEFGTDVFEIIDDARARRSADKRDEYDDPG